MTVTFDKTTLLHHCNPMALHPSVIAFLQSHASLAGLWHIRVRQRTKVLFMKDYWLQDSDVYIQQRLKRKIGNVLENDNGAQRRKKESRTSTRILRTRNGNRPSAET